MILFTKTSTHFNYLLMLIDFIFHSQNSSMSQVRVAVRARPLSFAEQTRGGKEIVNLSSTNRTISLGTNDFTFDSVYDSKLSQNDLYNDLSRPLLSSFLEGYNATVSIYPVHKNSKAICI